MSARKKQKAQATSERRENREKHVFKEASQSYTLETLPPEVLETVLRLLPFQHVASAVRLVSRHCSAVATTVLNGAFLTAGRRLKNAMKIIEKQRSGVKSDAEILMCMKTLNAMRMIEAQYNMLTAVTWRYTHPPMQQRFPRICFYAGSLLDDFDALLYRALKSPESFISPCTVDPSVTCFITHCRRFMYFFEKVSERRVNRSALVSGCKIVDILDCLVHGRQVLSFKVPPSTADGNGTVKMKLKYVMQRAWFTCLKVSNTAYEDSWRNEQRFMYLRLRRLVASVNEHFLECLHYDQESPYLQALSIAASKPLPSTYSGYGEYGNHFFCYGNMNQYAYNSKFKVTSNSASVNLGEETEEEVQGTPSFDLIVNIDLRCSPELAPLKIRNILGSDDLENPAGAGKCRELFLKLQITCPASTANRLPGDFAWELRSSRRHRRRRRSRRVRNNS